MRNSFLRALSARKTSVLRVQQCDKFQCTRVGSAGCAGVQETNFNDRAFSMKVYAPSRSVGIYARMPEPGEETAAS